MKIDFSHRVFRVGSLLLFLAFLAAIAKVGQEQIITPMHDRKWAVTSFAALLVVAIGFGAALIRQRREAYWLRSQLATERERARHATNFKAIFDAAPVGMVLVDENTSIARVNRAGAALVGKEPSKVTGCKPGDGLCCIHAAETPAGCGHSAACRDCTVRRAIGHVLREGREARNGELTLQVAGGGHQKQYCFAISVSLLALEGKKYAMLALLDISDRKRAEELQEQYAVALEGQRQAMEELYHAGEMANRAKSEFLSNMSHEIRTPMTAILGYADMLVGHLDDSEHVEALDIIRRNGHHLLHIINDILDLSKVEAGKLQVEWRPCSPAAVLREVVSLMRVRAEDKEIALKLEFTGPIPATILTDPARLRQILLNLVGNAIKFTETGSVRIVARLIDRDSPRPTFVCEVIDTGIGMTAEHIRDLFQPFQQADASTVRRFGGSGLGLAISKRLAGLLRGDITVASQSGHGSTFVLTLDPGPLSDVVFREGPGELAAIPAEPAASSELLPFLDCRVLLAEDGEDNKRLISLVLKKAGAEVVAVENGLEAVEAVLAARAGASRSENGSVGPFDVILMDMQMPVMDGYAAVRRLRAEGYCGPIIALTAHAMAEDRQKCLDAGCDAYSTKPIDWFELTNMIATILERHKALRGGEPASGLHPASFPEDTLS